MSGRYELNSDLKFFTQAFLIEFWLLGGRELRMSDEFRSGFWRMRNFAQMINMNIYCGLMDVMRNSSGDDFWNVILHHFDAPFLRSTEDGKAVTVVFESREEAEDALETLWKNPNAWASEIGRDTVRRAAKTFYENYA